MNAKEAREMAKGRSYAHRAFDNVIRTIRIACQSGHTSTVYYFDGSNAISPEELAKLIYLLEKEGYTVFQKNIQKNSWCIQISW